MLWFWGNSSANLSIKRPALPSTRRESSGVGEVLSVQRELDPSKAEVTVMIGWLRQEKEELHFSSMAVAALKGKEKGLRIVKKAKK
mmetsp:Transcript_30667/g.90917  ORF Transcript_30667/g.90917 Transcript_30667/m.90917 type:complete len:86 (-) Transcript_30667:469-726(-)